MPGEQGQMAPIGQDDRHLPKPRAGEALNCEDLIRGEGHAVLMRNHRPGQVTPEKCGMVPHRVSDERVARQDRHAARPCKSSVALRVIRCSGAAIAVHVNSGSDSRIGAKCEAVEHRIPGFGQQIGEGIERDIVEVKIKAEEEQDIRARREDCVAHRENIILLPPDVAQQQARPVAPQATLQNRQS